MLFTQKRPELKYWMLMAMSFKASLKSTLQEISLFSLYSERGIIEVGNGTTTGDGVYG